MAMAQRKAQALSIHTIVIIIIALLVLVLVVLFFSGGFSKYFGKMTSLGGTEVGDIKNGCNAMCNEAKLVTSKSQFTGTRYCTTTYNIDRDGDGSIDDPNNDGQDEADLYCWNDPIKVGCNFEIIGDVGEVPIIQDTTGTNNDCGVIA